VGLGLPGFGSAVHRHRLGIDQQREVCDRPWTRSCVSIGIAQKILFPASPAPKNRLDHPVQLSAKLAQPFLVAHNVYMDPQGRLLDAIKAKDPRRVRAAIAAGADLTADSKKSPLHVAAEVGDVEVINALPPAAVRKLIDSLDATDRTPLMCAAQKNRLEAAQALIDMGAEVNAKSSMGDTALRITAAEGTPEMARLLLAAGADPLLPGRLLLTPLDRSRERRTPEGRMITALFIRAGEAKNARPAGKSAKTGRAARSGARSRASGARLAKARRSGSTGKSKRPRR
jgi:hypothetical protein